MNRSILPVIFILLIGVVAVGFYRGWFTLTSESPQDGSKTDVQFSVDRDKVQEDADSIKKQAGDLIGNKPDPAAPADPVVPAGEAAPPKTIR